VLRRLKPFDVKRVTIASRIACSVAASIAPGRIAVLDLPASQAAISLENAVLYTT
jgi:hypothetical protein